MAKKSKFTPATFDRLPLSDDCWIEVKHELNNGDQKKLEAAGLKPPMNVGGKVISPIDWEVYEIRRALIFMSDWNYTDENDKPVALTEEALKALDAEAFEEINTAIFAHTMQVAAAKKLAREAKTRTETSPTASEPVSEPISS